MDADFTVLDRPDVAQTMFYPRRDRTLPPAGAEDLLVTVAEGVNVHLRIHAGDSALPSVLFFHGNGEVVADYDGAATVYEHYGLNLLLAEYRGYGASSGSPTFTAMLSDAHALKRTAFAWLDGHGYTAGRYVMGRSLGAGSAIELATAAPEGLRGLILESGAAGVNGWNRFLRPGDDPEAWQALQDAQRARIAAITLPLLSIHGERDDLVSIRSAEQIQELVGSTDKQLVRIKRAGHNDLLGVDLPLYFESLAAFVRRLEAAAAGA